MASESQLSDTTAKRRPAIVYLLGGVLALFLIYCFLGFHGDGWVEPTIRVQVSETDGSPIDEATVTFIPDSTLMSSTGTTNGQGQAKVQGSFGAAFYLWHTYISGRGILRVEKPGYLPVEVVIDSVERRREIRDELIELDITLKQGNPG